MRDRQIESESERRERPFKKDFNSAHIDSSSLMRENTVLACMWVWAVRKRKRRNI